jgi:hypothetical protein
MRAHGWLLGLGLGLALAAPASAQRALTWGSPITQIQNRVVNTAKAANTGYNSNIPIAAPYVTAPQHTKLSLSSFLPTGVGHMTAKPTHGSSIFPTQSQLPNRNYLAPFQWRNGP